MAKRESSTPPPKAQRSLFETQPTPAPQSFHDWKQVSGDEKRAKAARLKASGKPIYTISGWSIACHLCGTQSGNQIYLEHRYCAECDTFLDEVI